MTDRLTGRGVLLWLFIFFGVIIAVNSYFIVIASRTFSGEDEDKPYLQGVEFNHILARHAEQAALGWKAAISATRLSSGVVSVEIRMRDRTGNPVAWTGLVGELRHPSDENRDRALRWTQTGPGTYQARLSGVAPGIWDVLVHSVNDQTPFDAERRLWVR